MMGISPKRYLKMLPSTNDESSSMMNEWADPELDLLTEEFIKKEAERTGGKSLEIDPETLWWLTIPATPPPKVPKELQVRIHGVVQVYSAYPRLERVNLPAAPGDNNGGGLICLGSNITSDIFDHEKGDDWEFFKAEWVSFWCPEKVYPNRFPYTQTGNLWVPEDRQIKDITGGSMRTPHYLEDDSMGLSYISGGK